MADPDGPDLGGLAGLIARLADGGAESAWEEEVGAATHWYLDEHRVGRVPLLPGAAYIDLVVGLYTERFAGGSGVELRDVVFRAPFSDQGARRLRVEFTEHGEAGHTFSVRSRSVNDTGAVWAEHVTGIAAAVDVGARRVDLDEVRARMAGAEAVTAGGLPADPAFVMGPRWRNVVEVRQSADGTERLLALRLMPAFASDLGRHRLHPALLDTATAGVRSSGEGAFVPFLYRRLVVHADLPAEFFSRVRLRPGDADTAAGDVELVAPDGSVLAEVEGFTMRRVAFEPGWDRARSDAAVADPGDLAGRGESGLGLDTGMRLLMTLLAGDTPRAVLVRPHEDGAPTAPTAGPGGDHLMGAAQPIDAVTPQPAEPQPHPRQPTGRSATANATDTAPPTLATLWHLAVGTHPTSDEEDFFDAGGNSLSAVELIGRVRSAYGLELSIGLLLDVRTYGGLRRIVEGENE